MLDYLDQQMDRRLADFDTAIDWDTRNHTIELIIRLFAENTEGEAIDDAQGVISEEEIIEFEDAVLLYNTQKAKQQPDPEEYLAIIPFDGKKGMSQSLIDGVLLYLNEVLTEGQSDLLDFLNDPDQETFELVWDQQAFDQAVEKSALQTERFLPYPNY